MICENTISAGFYFMLGKFMFDAALIGAIAVIVFMFWFVVLFMHHRKKK